MSRRSEGTLDEDRLRQASIAVVIPAYRVAEKIEQVLAEIPAFVRWIIVVDDGSPDGTRARVEPLLSERIFLLRHRANQGVGGAMLSGYALALELGAEIVVKMDGDDQMDPAQMPRLVAPILQGEADYTKGNRFLHSAELHQMPLLRRIGNFGLTFMTKVSSGYWNLFDPNNGYTAIHRTALQLILPEAVARDYFFETSMLLELRRIGAVAMDVAIPARYGDETSSLSVRRVALSFPRRLFGGLLQRMGRQYFLYDFNTVSVLLVVGFPLLLFGLIWGSAHWYHSVSSGNVASTGTVLLAVLPIIIGVQFLAEALVLDVGTVPKRPLPEITDAALRLDPERSLSSLLLRQPVERVGATSAPNPAHDEEEDS